MNSGSHSLKLIFVEPFSWLGSVAANRRVTGICHGKITAAFRPLIFGQPPRILIKKATAKRFCSNYSIAGRVAQRLHAAAQRSIGAEAAPKEAGCAYRKRVSRVLATECLH
jgi:hypothetical protein